MHFDGAIRRHQIDPLELVGMGNGGLNVIDIPHQGNLYV
jgi:hypothetical protein